MWNSKPLTEKVGLTWICYCDNYQLNSTEKCKGKGKAAPLQALTGPEGSRKLRYTDFVTTAQDGGRLSVLRTGRLYPLGNVPGTHFC